MDLLVPLQPFQLSHHIKLCRQMGCIAPKSNLWGIVHRKKAAGSISDGFYVLSTASQALWHLISSPGLCLLWPVQGTKRLEVASKVFQVSSTRVAQHNATTAIGYAVRWGLTFVQFEDGVSHGRQHSLPFQDVDVPQPQGQCEWGLFQTHKQITNGLMKQMLLPSLHHFAPKYTTGLGFGSQESI